MTTEGATVLVGVDAGATKTHVLAVDAEGSVIARVEGQGANPKRHGLLIASERIAALARLAVPDAVPALVYIAGAGLDRPDQARAMERAVGNLLPGVRVMAANDTLAVLRCGAEDGVGLAVPVSTGGNVIGRGPDGRVTDRGHGIFGGGFALGALAARAARRGRVGEPLATAVDAAGLTWRGRRPEPAVAQLGVEVAMAAEAGDPYPARLVDRWCRRVTAAVAEEADRLGLGDGPAVIVYGGLLDASPWLGERIRRAVRAARPGARIRHLEGDPVEGAALLARDAWAGRLASWDFTPRR